MRQEFIFLQYLLFCYLQVVLCFPYCCQTFWNQNQSTFLDIQGWRKTVKLCFQQAEAVHTLSPSWKERIGKESSASLRNAKIQHQKTLRCQESVPLKTGWRAFLVKFLSCCCCASGKREIIRVIDWDDLEELKKTPRTSYYFFWVGLDHYPFMFTWCFG